MYVRAATFILVMECSSDYSFEILEFKRHTVLSFFLLFFNSS